MDTTVVKGLRVLEALARADEPLRLSQLSDALGLQRSNTHRLLSTLVELGYVEKEPASGRYRATLRMWEFGAGVVARHPLKRFATPYLQELHKATGETVSLTVLDGVEVLYVEKLLSPRPLRFTTQPGSRAPALLAASGRAMMALEPERAALIAESIARFPEMRDEDPKTLAEALDLARADGYVILESGRTTGVVGVAAAILGRDGRAAGALAISGPAQRFKEPARLAAAEAVQNACARIAEAAGAI